MNTNPNAKSNTNPSNPDQASIVLKDDRGSGRLSQPDRTNRITQITQIVETCNKLGDGLQVAVEFLKAEDFGQDQIGLAAIVKDPAIVGFGGVVISLGLIASGLGALVPAVVYLTVNDIKSLLKGEEKEIIPNLNPMQSKSELELELELESELEPELDINPESQKLVQIILTNASTNIDPDLDINFIPELGIINAIVDRPIPNHIAFTAITRTGKTLTLRAIIYKIFTQQPKATIRIVDPKNGKWMGLEKNKNGRDVAVRYLCQNGEIDISPLVYEINRAYETFINRVQKGLKEEPNYYLIIDEWYILYPELDLETMTKINRMVQLGLEFGLRFILITQSHLCKDFGFNSQARFAFRFAGLSRQGITETIDSMLSDQYLIPDKAKRDAMRNEFALFPKNSESPIVCLPSESRIEQLPDLKWLETFKFDSIDLGSVDELEPVLDNREEGGRENMDKEKLDLDSTKSDTKGSLSHLEESRNVDITILENNLALESTPSDPACQSIVEYMRSRSISFTTVRDLQRASLSGLNGLSSAQIQEKLDTLVSLEYGTLTPSGQTFAFQLF